MFAEKFGARNPAHFIANSAVWLMASAARMRYEREFPSPQPASDSHPVQDGAG